MKTQKKLIHLDESVELEYLIIGNANELQEIRNLIDKIIQKHISKGSDLSIINDFEQIDAEIFKVMKS